MYTTLKNLQHPPAFMEILLGFLAQGRGVGVTDLCLKDDPNVLIVEPVCAETERLAYMINFRSMKLTTMSQITTQLQLQQHTLLSDLILVNMEQMPAQTHTHTHTHTHTQ